MNLGEMIDELYNLRTKKSELNRQVELITEQYTALEAQVLEELQRQGTESARSSLATATVSESVVPNVTDWEAFYQYIIDTRQPYLLERRPSVVIYRDLLQAGEEVPGVSPFTKTSLSLRKR